ncbi:MAG: FtsQ-type POTRA domain-containing protein [Anaerolineae bacterium]|nr:FtsQ-type POTRA domain-containing protein [Anaerolineae bacterium]
MNKRRPYKRSQSSPSRTSQQGPTAQNGRRGRATGEKTRRYQNTAQAYTWHRTGTRPVSGVDLWKWLEQLRKPKNRRSKARLGKPKRMAPNLKATVLAPTQSMLRSKGQVVLNVLFLALVGWALIWFFTNEEFYVQQVNITGNVRVSSEAILAASSLQGYSIFWINAQQVATSIVKALPPIKHVRVQYGLPNVVNLIVEEQGGQIMWQLAGNRYWVDDDGMLHLAQVEATPSILVQDIRPGLPDRVDPEAVVAAQQLLTLLPDLQFIEYAPITGLRFVHPKGWLVYLGTGNDMEYKMSILHAIETQFADEEMTQPSLVDLRFPDSPYYRFPSANQEEN